jgi:Uma2 family endonuclease
MRLDDDLPLAFCAANRDPRIERNADGDLAIMPPAGAETGHHNAELALDFGNWARQDGRGVVLDSSTGFLLPNGTMRSPDLGWVLRGRLAQLSAEQKPPIPAPGPEPRRRAGLARRRPRRPACQAARVAGQLV